MALLFNIIYIRGTVHLLLPLLHSLLEYTSNCTFRLVDNGCEEQESRQLQRLCQQEDRVAYYALNTREVMEHWDVLNHLQSIETSDYFAFMDSDIFAVGPFLDSHMEALKTYTGICSCLPIGYSANASSEMSKDTTIVGGWRVKSHNGITLGVSYYAIYNNIALNALMRSTGLGFQKYTWEHVPSQYHETLEELGLKKSFYDTGKLLNIFLHLRGETLAYIDTPNLVHIGASSRVKPYHNYLYFFIKSKLYHMPFGWRRALRALRVPAFRHITKAEHAEIDFEAQRNLTATKYLSYLVSSDLNASPDVYLKDLPESLQLEIKVLGEQFLELREKYADNAWQGPR